MDKGNGGGRFLAGFLIGAVPAWPRQTLDARRARDRLGRKGPRGGKLCDGPRPATFAKRLKASHLNFSRAVSELYERGRQVVESARSNLDAAVAEGQAMAQETRDELQRKAEG